MEHKEEGRVTFFNAHIDGQPSQMENKRMNQKGKKERAYRMPQTCDGIRVCCAFYRRLNPLNLPWPSRAKLRGVDVRLVAG
jgi:hypothetical protein